MPTTTPVKKKSPSPEALRKAGCDYVRKQVAKFFENSQVKDHTNVYPRFRKEEVVMGKVLGEGGFGVVSEIRSIKKEPLRSASNDNYEMEEQERDFIAQHCIRDGGDARYAVKYLKQSVIDDPATFIMAIKDMAVESRFLSSLKHSNIVKMRALSTVDPYSENFFIVMDRLFDTLDKRIEKWQKKFKGTVGMVGRLNDKKGLRAAALLEERIVAAYDLSSAFEYLHSHK
jgi:serine/threonine protein kinase